MWHSRSNGARFLTLFLAFGTGAAVALDLEQHPGKAIYEKLCLDCHGPKGEGVKGKADDPLVGSRTLESLAGRIDRTMPEDEPELCVGEDAKTVAAYIYDAFYSVEARARNTPARIELSRLTVPQYRNSVADLVVSFRYDPWIPEERGLKANYFGDRSFTERKEFREQKKPDKYERADATVKFDFGEGIPKHDEAKEFSPEQFSVRWTGTLLPDETGVYEFVIRTRNGITLWVNDVDRGEEAGGKTIDGWVVPNNEVREETGSVFLVGGRPYPIRLDFFTYKEKAASIELLWKTPHGVLETIPTRNLAPNGSPETLLVDVPFPADDRSVGYERGTMVSKAWLEAVTAGAVMASDYVVKRLDELARTKRDQPDRRQKIEEFAGQFVARAFRRPLSEEEKERFVRVHFKDDAAPEQAVKRIVLQALTSPRFLYPELASEGKPDGWALASRLALFLWDSVPNQRLIDLASKGEFDKPERLDGIVSEMVWHWRTRAKMRGFYHHWLEMERADELVKDKEAFPGFDPAIAADLRTSLLIFLDEATWSKDKTDGYRQLLLSAEVPMNERLGKFYGVEVKGDFQPVALDGGKRAGLITHPYLLSYLAYHNNTSPIHRGVFLTRHLLGMPLKSPPMANEFKDSGFDPNLTMRQKVVEMTKSQDCMGCHVTINPLGFSLENYDGIGRWREQDRGRPVDATSDFHTDDGRDLKLSGPRDVAELAVASPSAHRAFIEKLFHHFVKQPVRAYDVDGMEKLRKTFEQSDYQIHYLIRQIALTAMTHSGGADDRFAKR